MAHDITHSRTADRVSVRRSPAGRTLVLWLMIALVFLPVAAAHAVLRLAGTDQAQELVLR